ncbi:MAG: hypothetical protein ABMA64_14360 [Myxococcota bacterium]
MVTGDGETLGEGFEEGALLGVVERQIEHERRLGRQDADVVRKDARSSDGLGWNDVDGAARRADPAAFDLHHQVSGRAGRGSRPDVAGRATGQVMGHGAAPRLRGAGEPDAERDEQRHQHAQVGVARAEIEASDHASDRGDQRRRQGAQREVGACEPAPQRVQAIAGDFDAERAHRRNRICSTAGLGQRGRPGWSPAGSSSCGRSVGAARLAWWSMAASSIGYRERFE